MEKISRKGFLKIAAAAAMSSVTAAGTGRLQRRLFQQHRRLHRRGHLHPRHLHRHRHRHR